MRISTLIKKINAIKNPDKAAVLSGFFKTGSGEYGEGDVFLGLTVPIQRSIAKEFAELSLVDLDSLLTSKYHEYRLTALLILVEKFHHSDQNGRKNIYEFYLAHSSRINNWDLVDLTAHKIVGAFLWQSKKKERAILDKLAVSSDLWERRIAMIACFYFIKNNEYDDAIRIATKLLSDSHDLMHKAAGWMLREIGKRNIEVEEIFLRKHYRAMPRTMLRYAIEKFDDEKRSFYMRK